MPFRFNTLLADAGIDPANVRLLRHQPTVGGRSLVELWRTDRPAFEDHQAYHGRYQARLLRVRLLGRVHWHVGQPHDVRGAVQRRLARAHRRAAPRTDPLTGSVDQPGEVDRYAIERPFPGLMALTLPLSAVADAPPAWTQALATSKGVSLLTCPRDGSLYVGSATGEGGFAGRWAEYAASGQGGNVGLKDREPSDHTVSVLQVAGSADTSDTIPAAEAAWKRKLMTGRHGLTRN